MEPILTKISLRTKKLCCTWLCGTLAFVAPYASLASDNAPVGKPARLESIEAFASKFRDSNSDLVTMFRSGLTNAEQKQSFEELDGSIYVQTGDIPAEWLRDSSAQVRPYLYFVNKDEKVRDYLRKVIARQAEYLTIDPYANAFREDKSVWEQKYELDSLCYPIILAWTYWKLSGDATIFTDTFQKAMHSVIETMRTEQDHAKSSQYTHKELLNGKGREVGKCGMVWMGFRPSDDACYYNYLIPSEMMAVVALRALIEIETSVFKDRKFLADIKALRNEIDAGIKKFAIVNDKKFGKVYAFEVDGLGNYTLEDDANIPSLLSLPYLGYVSNDDRVYLNTRKMILSKANKNFAEGKVASGIGSEHTPKTYIWPLAMIMDALTENDKQRYSLVLKQILASDPGDHLLHESFDPDDQKKFTRPDFGWPNALFAELILLKKEKMMELPVPRK